MLLIGSVEYSYSSQSSNVTLTELLLIGTMTAACYQLLKWFQTDELRFLLHAAFWIMLSTLVRYDGWFLFAVATGLIVLWIFFRRGYEQAEGTFVLFCTLTFIAYREDG